MSTVGPDPYGKVPEPCTCRPDHRERTRTPTGTTWTPRTGPRPLCVGSGSPTAGSRDSGTENTQALLKVWQGSGVDMCPGSAWCGPVRICYCSPPRRRPDAATWPTACDISQRAEPDVRPPSCAASVFIADKARRLTSDVPPRHLMRPAHSAVRRRPVHSTSKQRVASALMRPVHSAGRRHAHAAACTILIITRANRGSYRCVPTLRGLRTSRRQKISQVSPALVAPCISSIVSLGPHVGAQQPCMCPPWAIKGRAHDVTRHTNLDSQTHKFIQALKLNTAHSGVGYYAPVARTTLNPCVFLCSSSIEQQAKRLGPLLILGFRAGAFCHPAENFLSDIWRAR
jgi:hypothetical protein